MNFNLQKDLWKGEKITISTICYREERCNFSTLAGAEVMPATLEWSTRLADFDEYSIRMSA
jgi:hypothetical protein